MKITLDYGTTGLELDLAGLNARVLRPNYPPPLDDESAGFLQSVRNPIGSLPLKQKISATDRVAIAISDITRPLPTERLLGWLFEELSHVPKKNFVIISGTGTHRTNTKEEWLCMVGEDVFANCHCIDHEGTNSGTLVLGGRSPFGYDVFSTGNTWRRISES